MSHILELLTTGQVVPATMTIYDAIALALVKDGARSDHKFGDNAAVTTKATIWDVGGIYGYIDDASPGTAKTLKISSSSTNDVMTTGTGAWTVKVYGMDDQWAEQEETVELNGQNAVNTANQYLRVFRLEVVTAGSGAEAAGDIYAGDGTVTAGVPATKYAKIQQGNNQTLMALFTVPAGKKVIIPRWYSNVGQGKEAVIDAVVRNSANGRVFQLKQRRRLYQNTDPEKETIPFVFPEKHDLEIRATSSVSTAVCAGFQFAVVDA